MKLLGRVLALAALLTALSPGLAAADGFPSKPVTIIVPASPGTSIDAIARVFADSLSNRLQASIVVENRSGAGGLIAYRAAAEAAPDGHTLIMTGIPLYLLPLFASSGPTFDPVADFTPLARVARVQFAVVVAADSPYEDLSDLVEAMRAAPGSITYSSQGVGSSAHLCAVTLNDIAGTDSLHVAYKDTSMAMTDVAGGRVDFTCQTSTGILPLVSAGKLRALAVTGSERWTALPEVPTAGEAGIEGFEYSSQLDFMAPQGLPADVARLLSERIVEIARTPEFRQFARDQVLAVEIRNAEDLAPEIPVEAERWRAASELATKK